MLGEFRLDALVTRSDGLKNRICGVSGEDGMGDGSSGMEVHELFSKPPTPKRPLESQVAGWSRSRGMVRSAGKWL